MNRDILEQPFPKELLKSRKGPFGQSFSYVEGTEYIKRLNEAFAGEWSFEIQEHIRLDNEVIVLGKLSCAGIVKMAFGGSSITVSREGEIISIADDLKAAATDALKKACSLLGVGLHLYSDTAESNGNGRPSSSRSSSNGNGSGNGKPTNGASSNGNSGGNGNGAKPTNGNGDRLTQKQLSAIWSMGRALGQGVDAIRQHCTQAFNVQPEHLSKSDASAFISQMGESLGGGR